MRYDELAHMGVKGMKWRKGRKSGTDAGKAISDGVTKVYEKRQSQIQNGFGAGADIGAKVTEKRKKNLMKGMKKGASFGSRVPKSKLPKPELRKKKG